MRTGKRLTALTLVLAVLAGVLTACGSKLEAAAMHLKRAEGTVDVFDGEDKYVSPREGLGLYSGYEVGTQSESYAWVDLDEVKLVKLDEDSEIEILKEDKHLTIEVKSGALFFNVTEPLADDETMDIRSSSMMVGIRGTCGWVVVSEDGATMTLWLLEGTVECSVGDYSVTVHAGEKAVMNIDGTITVTPFTEDEIPYFVQVELEEDGGAQPEETDAEASAAPQRSREKPVRMTNYQVDGTPIGLMEYTYTRDRLGVTWEHYNWFDEEWVADARGETVYDEQGIEQESQVYYVPEDMLMYESKLTEEKGEQRAYRSYDADGQLFAEIIHHLDGQGQVTQTEQINYGSDGNVSIRIVSDYDELGDVVRMETWSASGSVTVRDYVNIHDSQGRLTQRDEYGEDGVLKGYTLFEYES